MNCEECTALISGHIDGELSPPLQQACTDHLAQCPACMRVRDDIVQLVLMSRSLPLHTPSRDLWQRIEAEVGLKTPVDKASSAVSRFLRLGHREFRLSLLQLALGAAFLMVLAATAVSLRYGKGPSPQAAGIVSSPASTASAPAPREAVEVAQIESRISELTTELDRKKRSWQPAIRQAFDRNLHYVDQGLAECRLQLGDNPDDRVSRELMLTAYREKMRLLEGFEKF